MQKSLLVVYLVSQSGQSSVEDLWKCRLVSNEMTIQSVALLVAPLVLEEQMSLETLRVLDGILFKSSDFLLAKDTREYVYSEDFLQLVNNLQQLPDICVIDSLEQTQRVVDRSSFPSLLSGCEDVSEETSICTFPSQFVMNDVLSEDEFCQKLISHGMHFPLIVKPASACGTSSAHFMAIVYDPSGSSRLEMERPLCVQQFYHHGRNLWKVYVTGNHVFIEREVSLDCVDESSSGVMHFNALDIKKAATQDQQESRDDTQLDPNAILRTAEALRRSTGLVVFGFDVIVDEESSQAFVVDVNHFPSMKRVQQSIPALHDALYKTICTYQQSRA